MTVVGCVAVVVVVDAGGVVVVVVDSDGVVCFIVTLLLITEVVCNGFVVFSLYIIVVFVSGFFVVGVVVDVVVGVVVDVVVDGVVDGVVTIAPQMIP